MIAGIAKLKIWTSMASSAQPPKHAQNVRFSLGARSPYHLTERDPVPDRMVIPLTIASSTVTSSSFRVCLVNARHAKNVPGRKTDVADRQWLQHLHSVGLLRASFRPAQVICTVRSIVRHCESLVQTAATHVQHMQKALDQMNLRLHHVISDITGQTGTAIIDRILAGERDPAMLAKLRDKRIRASEETIIQSLTGDYRREHLFTLRQSLEAFRYHQQLIAECDREIHQSLALVDSKMDVEQHRLSKPKDRHKPRRNEPRFDVRSELLRIFGVDLTEIPGIKALTAHTLLTEIGADLSKFPNSAAFASWLGLWPDTTASVAARSCLQKLAPSKAARLSPCAWPRDRCIAMNPIAANSSVECAPNSEPPGQSPPPPTNSLALCSICCRPGSRIKKASSPYKRRTIALDSQPG